MKKETVRFLIAPTGWICLEPLNSMLVKSGMKYPSITKIGKGAMIMGKASDVAWKSKTVYCLLRLPPQLGIFVYEGEILVKEMRLYPQKRLQGIFVLQYL